MIQISTIQDLLKLPYQGIYGLVNHSTKRFIICQTANSITGISRVLNQIKTGSYSIKELCRDRDDLELVWLETNKSVTYRNFHVEYFVKVFEDKGYSNYRTKPYKRFKAKVDYLLTALEDGSPMPIGVCIRLFTHSKVYGIMGVWETMEEAEEFLEYYYSNQDLVLPVYALNKHSIEYFKTGKLNSLQIK